MNILQRASKRSKTDGGAKIRELRKTSESFISSLEMILTSSSKVGNLRNKLEETTERLLKEFEKEVAKATEDAGVFLCNLDDRKHDEETVTNVINVFPEALKYTNDRSRVPVQALLNGPSVGYSFVPLLASEGRRLKMFSEEEKGGLASNHSPDAFRAVFFNYLTSYGSFILRKKLVSIERDPYDTRLSNGGSAEFKKALEAEINIEHDEKCTRNLQKLFKLGILEKNDIVDCEMIYTSASSKTKKRFDFVVNLCPESLEVPNYQNDLPIHRDAERGNEDGFGTLLKAGLEYYPRKLGFLFHKHSESGKTPLDLAMGNEKMNLSHCKDFFKWIHEVIPPSKGQPILQDIIRLSPKYFSLFWNHYPDAILLRDRKGRLPLHVALQKACKWSHLLVAMININDPIDRHEKDPVTGLYPFMSAASGRGDLNLIYFLLRRDPNTWEGFRSCTK